MKRLVSIFCFLAVLVTVCMSGEPDHPKPNITSILRDTIKKTDRIFVYEGLPHQMFEAELLEKEKKRKDTTSIANYSFYAPKTQVENKALVKMKTIISDSKNYIQFTGEKRCGGFHPDYAVEWPNGEKTYAVLFCFGCDEVLVVDGKNIYRYDLRFPDQIKKIFAAYKSKRPKVSLR